MLKLHTSDLTEKARPFRHSGAVHLIRILAAVATGGTGLMGCSRLMKGSEEAHDVNMDVDVEFWRLGSLFSLFNEIESPKSLTLATRWLFRRTLLAHRSQWTICLVSRNSKAQHI